MEIAPIYKTSNEKASSLEIKTDAQFLTILNQRKKRKCLDLSDFNFKCSFNGKLETKVEYEWEQIIFPNEK